MGAPEASSALLCGLSLLACASAASGQDGPRARLDLQLTPGAERCPGADDLRAAVAARLGRDPIDPTAPCSCCTRSTAARSPRWLGALRVTATPESGVPVTLTASPMVRGSWVIADYYADLPDLSPGTRVRIEVGATASSSAFSRDLEVSDVEYVSPTPVIDTAMARYLTWTPGTPLEIHWRRISTAPTTVGFTFNLFTTASEAYSLVCTSAAGATHLTVPSSVLTAFHDLSPSMGVGGVTSILTASAQTRSMVGAVEVTTSTGSFTVSGTRW